MDVEALIDAWKLKMVTDGEVRAREDSETEGEGEESEPGRRMKKQRAIQDAENQLKALKHTNEQLRLSANRLKAEVARFQCDAAARYIDALVWYVDFLYSNSLTTFGTWASALETLSGSQSASGAILRGEFPLFMTTRNDVDADELLILRREEMGKRVPTLYDFVEEALMNHKFLKPPIVPSFGAQDPGALDYGSTDDESDGDESVEDAPSEAASVAPPPIAQTYAALLQSVLQALPAGLNRAKEELTTENHSIFSHSYDFLLEFDAEGGGLQLPPRRSYFYRDAENEPEQQFQVSPANRNADLAAFLRSAVLFVVVIGGEARNDLESAVAASLNLVDPQADDRYQQVVASISELHDAMLSASDQVALLNTAERFEAYQNFVAQHQLPLELTMSNNESPLVDLMTRVLEVGFDLMCARFASGAFEASNIFDLKAFPTPVLEKPLFDESDSDSEILEIGKPDAEPVDSQETLVDEEPEAPEAPAAPSAPSEEPEDLDADFLDGWVKKLRARNRVERVERVEVTEI